MADAPPRRRSGWPRLLGRLGPLLALVLLVVGTVAYEGIRPAFDLVEDPETYEWVEGPGWSALADWEFIRTIPDRSTFLKPDNILNVLRQAAPIGIVAVGMTFVIISGGIDLSVGSMVALAGIMGLLAINRVMDGGWLGGGPGTAAAAGAAVMVLGGLLLGLANGLLVGLGRLAPFIATLGTMAIYRSLALARADGSTVMSRSSVFGEWGVGGIELPFLTAPDGPPVRLHYPIIVFLLVAAAGALLLRFTTYGTHVRALGDNPKAAVYAAIPTRRVKVATYTLLGLLSGVAALVASSRQNSFSSSSAGLFYELDAIAAVVIGGTLMQGGAGTVLGTLIGVLILAVIGNMLVLVGVGSYYQGLAKGLIIIAAVLVQRGGRE